MSGTVPTIYFQLLDSRNSIIDVRDLASAQTAAIYNGYVAALNSAGDFHLADGTENPFGLFYEHLALEEYPTGTNLTTYRTADACAVVTGRFRALCAAALFGEGTVPAAGAILYDGEAGLVAASGTSIVGRCIGTASVGGDSTVAECLFDFPSLLA